MRCDLVEGMFAYMCTYIYKCIDKDIHTRIYVYISARWKQCTAVAATTWELRFVTVAWVKKGQKKIKQLGAVSPVSTTGTAIYGHGAAGAGTGRCRWQGCVTLLGTRSLLAAAASCQPAPSVTWCSSPPTDSWMAGISRCFCHLLFQRPGNVIPCIEGWHRNLVSCPGGYVGFQTFCSTMMDGSKPKGWENILN